MFQQLPADTMTMNTEDAYRAVEEAAQAWVEAGAAAGDILSKFQL